MSMHLQPVSANHWTPYPLTSENPFTVGAAWQEICTNKFGYDGKSKSVIEVRNTQGSEVRVNTLTIKPAPAGSK